MARRLALAAVAIAAAAAAGPAGAQQTRILRAATAEHHHLLLRITVSNDLLPVEVAAATTRSEDTSGALLRANVRLRETIKLAPSASGLIRWRSRKTLPTGVYFVQVEAIEQGGVTDCPHSQRNCLEHWSNVRRVTVT